MDDSVITSLNAMTVDTFIVPGGRMKYIQAPDILWNKPVKDACKEKYDDWICTVGIYNETAARNLRALPRKTVFQWILQSWADISTDLIEKSFPCSGFNLPVNGSDEDNIVCFQDRASAKGKEMLVSIIDFIRA